MTKKIHIVRTNWGLFLLFLRFQLIRNEKLSEVLFATYIVSIALCVFLTAFCRRRQEKPILNNINTHLPGIKLKNETHKERAVQQVLVKYKQQNTCF